MEPKHESEYVDFEPASDVEKKLTLSDAAPATGAAAALSAPADPTIGGAIPTIQLTRADIDHQTLREALEELGSTRDRTARGAIVNPVDAMCGFTLRNPNHIWPSIPVYEQSRARAPKRQAGCSDGRAPRKGRFDKKDPANINNDNNSSGNSNDNFKIKPSSRSDGRSTSGNNGRSSGPTQRQRGHANGATISSSYG
eukprot:jgi/Undpi1/11978/HiC_scaffold_4.g01677.m1